MIKSMLLTAQLALSPIVGTNGLQPKQLPNPVYGETIDYSVKYEGSTYQRIGYSNQYGEYWYDSVNNNLSIIVSTDTPQTIETDSLAWKQSTIEVNLYTPYNNSWFTFMYDEGSEEWAVDEAVLQQGKCWAFFWQSEDTNELKYYQFFGGDGINDPYGEILYFEKSPTDYMEVDSEELHDLSNWAIPKTGKFLFTAPQEHLYNTNPYIIPLTQPTIANPSVYDNIYNFFYQNLFANEALDELGAEVGNNSLTMRQWLAHTATIISISLLSAALVFLVIKIFKLIAGSISDIWG